MHSYRSLNEVARQTVHTALLEEADNLPHMAPFGIMIYLPPGMWLVH